MFEWIADNKDLLIAIFGAGGAGTLVLVALLARSGASTEEDSDPGAGAQAAPQGVNVTASGGGIAVGHVGTGDIDLRFNEAVGEDAINDLQQSLDLSLTEAARLLKALAAAGLSRGERDATLARISADGGMRDALISALRSNDVPRATAIVTRAAASLGPFPPDNAS